MLFQYSMSMFNSFTSLSCHKREQAKSQNEQRWARAALRLTIICLLWNILLPNLPEKMALSLPWKTSNSVIIKKFRKRITFLQRVSFCLNHSLLEEPQSILQSRNKTPLISRNHSKWDVRVCACEASESSFLSTSQSRYHTDTYLRDSGGYSGL